MAFTAESTTSDSHPSLEGAPSGSDRVESAIAEEPVEYPTGLKLALVSLAMGLSMFLVALDSTILAVAIPKITDQFHSLDDIGWYGSAYFLTSASFQLLYGRLYSFLSLKWVYVAAVTIFEIGSLICGVAPSSTVLIVGRAIAGLGCSGLTTGTLIICSQTVPLNRRAIYMGLVAAVYWMGSVAGPLLGGVLTDKVSWRWCFYINLPIGAVTLLVIILLFKAPPTASGDIKSTGWADRIKQLDLWGTLVFIPAIVCLLLVLQWGGSIYPWNDGRIIALFVLFGVLIAVFVAIQIWKQEDATVPPRILKQRGTIAAVWFALCFSGGFCTFIYLLPIWFQAVKGVSAVKSGVDQLPLILSLVVSSLISGGLVSTVGYYTPFMILGSLLTSIGAGLLSTFEVDTGHAMWIGYQVMYGLGVGAGIQQPVMVVQTVLAPQDVATGTSLILFMQTLAGAVFVSVGQNVFRNKLVSGLASQLPSLDPALVLDNGATSLRGTVPSELLPAVLAVYNDALMSGIYACVAMAALSMVGALATEWRNVNDKGKSEPDVEKNSSRP
ncbi:major facilitator superfamily domain-containing protein [Mycena crocata]|nr:major facilitator superfamily domain-containing protein [Mycena crocata]